MDSWRSYPVIPISRWRRASRFCFSINYETICCQHSLQIGRLCHSEEHVMDVDLQKHWEKKSCNEIQTELDWRKRAEGRGGSAKRMSTFRLWVNKRGLDESCNLSRQPGYWTRRELAWRRNNAASQSRSLHKLVEMRQGRGSETTTGSQFLYICKYNWVCLGYAFVNMYIDILYTHTSQFSWFRSVIRFSVIDAYGTYVAQ